MPESINTFFDGLNQDVSKSVIPKNKYIDARNMRLVTNRGSSNYSIENVLGNNLSFTIPDTYKVYKISIIGNASDTSTITISGQTSATFTLPSNDTTGEQLYNFLNNDATLTEFGVDYFVAKGEDYLIVYSQSEDTSVSTSNSSALSVTTVVEAQTGLIPIGFTTIRDDIYIYTTSNTSENPGGHDQSVLTNPSSAGQIWKVSYDADYNATITLLYNNILDFTTAHPIAPTATLGRYENDSIKRLYWTDFFNSLRSINVADPDIMALDPSVLDIRPAIDIDIPILQEVSAGGTLDVGCYNFSYALKNTNGAISNYCPLSNNVFVVEQDEATVTNGANFNEYIGAANGTATGKKITMRIEDVDKDYDRIECYVVIRNTLTGTPTVYKFLDEPISSGTFEFDYTGMEDVVEVTIEDFVEVSTAFTHCKTISTKDNRLLVGNVKSLNQNIIFDARAYQFDSSPGSPAAFDIEENGVSTEYNVTNWESIAETSDANNPDPSTYKYQSDGSTIGGEGPNISYTFGTVAIKCDETINPTAGPPQSAPFRRTNQNYLTSVVNTIDVTQRDNSTEYTYPLNSINEDIKCAYYSGLLKGYQHEETYRFGITFFDNQGAPMFTKWIGDIKFPAVTDTCPASNRIYLDGTSQTTVSTFAPSFVASSVAYVNQMYIEFTVNIPANIRNKVKGYEISRVERKDEDKSILACGILNQVYNDSATLFIPDKQEISGPYGGYTFLNINTDAETRLANCTFDSPEFLLDSYNYRAGDQLKVVATFNYDNTTTQEVYIAAGEPYSIYKHYTMNSVTPASYDIDAAGMVDMADSYNLTDGSGFIFRNYTRTTTNTSDAVGSKTLFLELGTSLDLYSDFTCTEANGRKAIAYYVRARSSQYGGNSYTQRGANAYMSCSHFKPISQGDGTTFSETNKVFGGDVFCTIYDNQKEIKNWGSGQGHARGQYTGGTYANAVDDNKSHTQYFPCTSAHNTDLRHGDHVNYNLDNDAGTDASGFEEYTYNQVYSCENNVFIRYSKPAPFNEQFIFDNRFYASQVKINGELADSWGQFDVNNYWDVEGSYGPINSMDILNDQMLFWQDSSFGILSINPRSLIQDASGAELQLGTGNVIQRHDYVSTELGCKHQWGMCKSPHSYFFFDVFNKRMYKYSASGVKPLSDLGGMQSFFRNKIKGDIIDSDNPVGSYGITATYDNDFHEAIFTFINSAQISAGDLGDFIIGEAGDLGGFITEGVGDLVDLGAIDTVRYKETIVYNETVGDNGAFTSFYDFAPDFFINDGKVLFSMDTVNLNSKNKIYLHGKGTNYSQFYGIRYDSKLSFVVNDNFHYSKVFDNLEWLTEVDVLDSSTGDVVNIQNSTWTELRVRNDYQNTDYQLLDPSSLTPNIKRRERTWKLAIPRNRVQYTSTASPNIYSDLATSDKSFGERMRDKYAIIDLKYNNVNDYRLVFHNCKTLYRISSR